MRNPSHNPNSHNLKSSSCHNHNPQPNINNLMSEPPKPGKGGLLPGEYILSREEAKLINLIRDLRGGELTVEIRNGKPVMAKMIRQDIKFD